jgi:tetratricopeptide (TPR) repeat protein
MASEHVCLVVMTKNESENVLAMLKSCEGLYSAVVWGFDDKTEDNTKELVLEYFKDKDHIQQVFYDFTWKNDFSYARNLYLDLALQKFPNKPWLLILDGDDLLSPGDPDNGIPDSREIIKELTSLPVDQVKSKAINFYVYLDPDPYGIPTLFYPRVHLVRNLPDVRFQFASHNAITVSGDEQILARECIVLHSQKPKKRAEREKQRLEMNVPNLKKQGDIEGQDGARGLFYLGNTLMDGGDHEGAEKAYLEYLEKSTWSDERYQTRLHLAGLYLLKNKIDEAENQARLALSEQNQWSRAEAYVVLSDCALARGNTLECIHWLRIAASCMPQVNGLFLQGHLFTWFPHWRLAMILDRLGFYEEALHHAEQAARYRPSPEIVQGVEILRNYIAMLKQLNKKIAQLHDVETFVPLNCISQKKLAERLGL